MSMRRSNNSRRTHSNNEEGSDDNESDTGELPNKYRRISISGDDGETYESSTGNDCEKNDDSVAESEESCNSGKINDDNYEARNDNYYNAPQEVLCNRAPSLGDGYSNRNDFCYDMQRAQVQESNETYMNVRNDNQNNNYVQTSNYNHCDYRQNSNSNSGSSSATNVRSRSGNNDTTQSQAQIQLAAGRHNDDFGRSITVYRKSYQETLTIAVNEQQPQQQEEELLHTPIPRSGGFTSPSDYDSDTYGEEADDERSDIANCSNVNSTIKRERPHSDSDLLESSQSDSTRCSSPSPDDDDYAASAEASEKSLSVSDSDDSDTDSNKSVIKRPLATTEHVIKSIAIERDEDKYASATDESAKTTHTSISDCDDSDTDSNKSIIKRPLAEGSENNATAIFKQTDEDDCASATDTSANTVSHKSASESDDSYCDSNKSIGERPMEIDINTAVVKDEDSDTDSNKSAVEKCLKSNANGGRKPKMKQIPTSDETGSDSFQSVVELPIKMNTKTTDVDSDSDSIRAALKKSVKVNANDALPSLEPDRISECDESDTDSNKSSIKRPIEVNTNTALPSLESERISDGSDESDTDSNKSILQRPLEINVSTTTLLPSKNAHYIENVQKTNSDCGDSDDFDDDELKLQIDDSGKLSSGGNSTPTSVCSIFVPAMRDTPPKSTSSEAGDEECNKRGNNSNGSGSEKEADRNDSHKSCTSSATKKNRIVTMTTDSTELLAEQAVKRTQKTEDSESDTTSEESSNHRLNKVVNNANAAKSEDFPLHNSGTPSLPLRQFQRIPIYIVEYHDEVLEFIFKSIASRHLPLSNNTLVHFDSHPDMVISRDLLARDTYDKDSILNQTSIENWIMPLCFTGIVSRIVWVKNPWCHQIPAGRNDFNIGVKNGKLFADNPLVYFLTEGNYCEPSQLTNGRRIELFVIDAEAFDNELPLNSNELPFDFPDLYNFLKRGEGVEVKAQSYILDIDLDFFSTSNPFLNLYSTCQCYQGLTEIFAFENDESNPVAANERRIQKLDVLKSIFDHLEEHDNLDDYEPAADLIPLSKADFRAVERFTEKVRHYYPNERIKWSILYDAGCTTDSGGLPHHISTEFELQQYYTRFRRFLKFLPYHPTFVTISRSTEDDYCPPNQVEDIQVTVLDCLELEFGDQLHNDGIYAYLEEEYNIMEL